MAGIDVNKITSTLARLPDQALQQYAQMHKNDPYIMSLAVSESTRRKELRAAGQSQQGMQEQPKVADAALAQMAPQQMPQEQGIAALPAPNMQQMADGGIAGYEGYDEGGMTYGQDPVMMMADGGVARFNGTQSQFVQDLAGIPAAYKKWWQQNREEDAAKAAKEQGMSQRRQEMLDARQKTSFANYLFGSPEAEAAGQAELSQLTGPTAAQQQAEYIRQQDKLMKGYGPRRTGDEFEGEEAAIAARAAAPAPEISKTKGPGKGTGTGTGAGKDKANIKPPPTPVATAAAAPSGGITDLFKASTAAELGAEADALSTKDIARMEKEYSPFLAELKAEKESLGKRRDSNSAEALIRAGLSIAGGKSRNALQNIAEGAKEGFSAFAEANKADEAARRALRQSEMAMMQAQRAERSGYHKDAIALTNQARQEKQFAVSAANQAEQLKNTKAYQEGSLANQKLMAQAALQRASNVGGGAMSKEAQLKLNNLKALVGSLKDELKDPFLNLPRNAEIKKAKTAQLAQAQSALAQGAGLATMMPASPTGASGGVKFLGYEE